MSRAAARPTFVIAGAPKCGTTSLSEYLRSNPDVFVTTPKEPFYFTEDLPTLRKVRSEEAYLSLFERAPESARCRGEATALYLFSSEALPRIRRFEPESRIVVMLRNPVEMVRSLHSQLLYSFFEDEPDFARAWALQDERSAGRRLPRRCSEPRVLQYGEIGMLGLQVERLLGLFPREQVHFIALDEFVAEPGRVYRRVLDFLGAGDDGRSDFPVFNPSGTHRFPALSSLKNRLLASRPEADALMRRAARRLGAEDLARRLLSKPLKPEGRAPLDAETLATLEAFFAEDSRRLAALVGPELVPWAPA